MRGHTRRRRATQYIYCQHTPPPSHICPTKKDTITQTKHYIEKSHRITIQLINLIFIESHFERLNIVNYKFIECAKWLDIWPFTLLSFLQPK